MNFRKTTCRLVIELGFDSEGLIGIPWSEKTCMFLVAQCGGIQKTRAKTSTDAAINLPREVRVSIALVLIGVSPKYDFTKYIALIPSCGICKLPILNSQDMARLLAKPLAMSLPGTRIKFQKQNSAASQAANWSIVSQDDYLGWMVFK
jgi:hypothetical protein